MPHCDICGNYGSVHLKKIDSGEQVCRDCLRKMRDNRNPATLAQERTMQLFRLFPRTRQQWQTIAIVIGLGLLSWQVWTVHELNARLDSIESTVSNIESDIS